MPTGRWWGSNQQLSSGRYAFCATLDPPQLSRLHDAMTEYGRERHLRPKHLSEQCIDPFDGARPRRLFRHRTTGPLRTHSFSHKQASPAGRERFKEELPSYDKPFARGGADQKEIACRPMLTKPPSTAPRQP